MDFPEILAQLDDLPDTYKRRGSPYTNFIEALTSALFLYTEASDGLYAQTNFETASNGWIDVWGSLAGIPRRINESDTVYHNRISNMVLAFHGTPVAITDWLSIVEQVNGSVTENFPEVGYLITLPPSLLLSQIQQILVDLAYVRPAGVPFVVSQESGNSYLDTVNYLDSPRVTGAYLAGSTLNVAALISSYTTNVTSLLPDLLFTDPLINPNLPPQPEVVAPQPSILATSQLFSVRCTSSVFPVSGATVLGTYQGGSTNFSWYFDPASITSPSVVQSNIDLCIANIEPCYQTLVSYYNATPVSGQPSPTAQDPSGTKFNNIILGPGKTPGVAVHCTQRFGDIYICEDAAYSAKAVMFEALAELVECFSLNYNTGATQPWAPGNFVGEGLSVVLAESLLDSVVFGIENTGLSQIWLNQNDPFQSDANRHNYASGSLIGPVGADTNQFAVGYCVLILYWLRYHRAFTWQQIVQNGGLTPNATCVNLGVSSATFLTDIQTLLPSGTQYNLAALYPSHPDNPWL